MLIYDKDTDFSSASLSVNVGTNASTSDMPGLPHFLEHMLFMGSKKYPNVLYYLVSRKIHFQIRLLKLMEFIMLILLMKKLIINFKVLINNSKKF